MIKAVLYFLPILFLLSQYLNQYIILTVDAPPLSIFDAAYAY